MKIKLLILIAMGHGFIDCMVKNNKGLVNRRFAEKHFREKLEPLLQGFRRKLHQEEKSIWMTSEEYEEGTVVVRASVQFQDIAALVLSESYGPLRLEKLKKNFKAL